MTTAHRLAPRSRCSISAISIPRRSGWRGFQLAEKGSIESIKRNRETFRRLPFPWMARIALVLLTIAAGSVSAKELFLGRSYRAGDLPVSAAAGDVNGDTFADLVSANSSTDDVSVLLGNGDGTFQAATAFPTGSSPGSVAIADLDGDTFLDVAVSTGVTYEGGSGEAIVLLGNGHGTFRSARHFTVGTGPWSVAVGDLDGDTMPDAVTANYESDDVSVLLNQSTPAASVPVPALTLGGLIAAASLLVGAGLRSARRATSQSPEERAGELGSPITR